MRPLLQVSSSEVPSGEKERKTCRGCDCYHQWMGQDCRKCPENSERITFCGVVFFLKNSCVVKSPPPRVLINVKHHTQRGICFKGGGLFKVPSFWGFAFEMMGFCLTKITHDSWCREPASFFLKGLEVWT